MPELVQAAKPIVKSPGENRGYALVFSGVLVDGAKLASIESVTVSGNRAGEAAPDTLDYTADSGEVNVATVVDRITGDSYPVGEVALFRLSGGKSGRDYWVKVQALDDESPANTVEGWALVQVRSPVAP